ncbi:hypothetical protein DTO006G1_5798 [Penicillium roqueforti]|uniref:uncharacterized protein n=1 Tax=Penicillium roqueforti TaxID=5082 RepID=UPI00190D14CC|nr:uncharacterized protein LCP9604111_2898 [Penicillium roqueforti]KAF9250694.1 hypothetical protein LCP9604111_2898 [Penicillium roqueforti]KAI1836816.1 hypothetical protein CBS147337_2068 [Penicillium roqueforti]KAI2677874.1 hypothetical protein CBS147355_4875 [Penicillium roqueforti]KAI2686775.1 hypothetical protein LCP963914a_4375 [Penicillium roqueforti]KAI2704238.1 hypothetical protein CBS147372_2707 [Penicillium roqueforti]
MFWALGPRSKKKNVTSSTPLHGGATSSTSLIRKNHSRAQVEIRFKYPVGAVIILVLLFFSYGSCWGAKIQRNPYECPTLPENPDPAHEQRNPTSERLERPQFLCFLRETYSSNTLKVSNWEKKHRDTKTLQYIFIAYTTIQFSHDQKRDDMEVLHSIAEKAARRAGVQVYWLACSCKTWSAQPWLFGFEGYLPTHEIEALVIVVNMNRLAWTPYSSQLSRHCMVDGECIGRNPTEDPKVKRIVDSSAYATREAAGVSAPLWKRGWYAPRSTLFL